VLIGPPPAPGGAGNGVSRFALVSGAPQASVQMGPFAGDSAADFDTGADIVAILLVGVSDAASVDVGPA
jgi:uracil-DNA glycosylase